MPDEVANEHGVAVRGDLAVALESGKGRVDRPLSQPGVVGHAPPGDRQHAEVVGMGAGEEVEVQQLFRGAQIFDVGIGPERHADGAVGRHYATSTIRTLPVIIQRTRERRDKGRSHKAAMAAFSPRRASFCRSSNKGTRPAHLPERDRKTVADMGTSQRWVLSAAHKKRQGDAPLR